jgi:hypothetical protein
MFRIPNFPLYVPWFIFDIDNGQLITSPIVPSDIVDTKEIILAEIQVPGLNYQPVQSGGLGNRKISFTLQLIKRDGINGNLTLLKQFELLRNPSFSVKNVVQKTNQFNPNPKVIYFWGTGSLPLIYYVSRCEFTHKQGFINSFGVPQNTEVAMELILDESNPVNKAEEIFRQTTAYAGNLTGLLDTVSSFTSRRPY